MAWRISDNLIEGTMDNTVAGKVTGQLRFIGKKRPVRLDLAGDIAGEAKGKRLVLRNANPQERNRLLPGPRGHRPGTYMTGFHAVQRGGTGTMKVGEHGAYLEWFGEKNGRVVLELPRRQVEIVNE